MSYEIIIKEIESKKDIKKFIDFQYKLYNGNKYWIPPPKMDEVDSLLKDKNPAFDFCEARFWLAYQNNKIVGRIAGLINHRYNEKFNVKNIRFGWFDFIDNPEIPKLLLKKVEEWGKEKGLNFIHGPIGFTDMDSAGTLIEGFEEEGTLGSIYNYRYYPGYIENCGYEKDADWIEFQVSMNGQLIDKMGRIAELALQKNNLKVLKVKKAKELLPYAKEIFYLLNETYKDIYGFVELSDKQIDKYVKQYFGYILPEFVPVVLDQDNHVVAFGITMPSLNKAFLKNKGSMFPFGFIRLLKEMKQSRTVDLYLTGVRPDYQNKGVNAILIWEMNKLFISRKIEKVETNRELELNNKIQSQWKSFDTRLHKRRRCYKKDL